MSWRGGRGRGRGRGRGGGGRGRGKGQGEIGLDVNGNVKNEPFVLFPEITLPNPKSISIDSELDSSYFNFLWSWRKSSHYLGDGVSREREYQMLDIDWFSNKGKDLESLMSKLKYDKSGSFYDDLVLRPDNFPKELLGDTPRERPAKRVKCSQETDLQKLDVFEKLEAKYKAEGKEEKEEGEDDEEVEESEGEESDNGDYDQIQDFDDDDDDYNQADDGEYEELY